MNEKLYSLVSWGLDELVWGGDLIGAENLPEHGPAVFVSNHLGALGPIAVGASLPVKLHFWIHADMLDPCLAPDYLRRDFVEGQLHLAQPLSGWLAVVISRIHVPLLTMLGGIPVYHTPEGHLTTFQLSIDLLAQGEDILIFPEDPELPLDARYQMAPFKKGFTRLGEMYFERTKKILSFYPLAVHAESLTVHVGKPIRYNPINNPASERARIKELLERTIHEMYLQASHGEIVQLPLPN
jgi:1-acyl-sn-glycerol-3-phosphate acyltransferase